MQSLGALELEFEEDDIWGFSERVADGIVSSLEETLASARKHRTQPQEGASAADVLSCLADDILCARICLNIIKRVERILTGRIRFLVERAKKNADEHSVVNTDRRLSQLPFDVITNIISFLPSRARIKGIDDYYYGDIHGWLPHVIIDPSLRLTADINLEVNVQILQQSIALECVDFNVHIPASWLEEYPENLELLLQFPHRWKELSIELEDFHQLILILSKCKPCLPYIKELIIEVARRPQKELIDDSMVIQDGGDSFQGKVAELKSMHIPRKILLPLLRHGLLSSVTDLTLTKNDKRDEYWEGCLSLKTLHVLSELSNLKNLRLIGVDWYETAESEGNQNNTLVKSHSLRSLRIDGILEHCLIAYLSLFVECTIERIGVHMDCETDTLVEILDNHFPNMKKLELLKGSYDYLTPIELSGTYEDGSFPLPALEHIGVSASDMLPDKLEELRQYIFEGLCARFYAPGVQSIKHISVTSNVVDPLFQYEAERLVPSVVVVQSTK